MIDDVEKHIKKRFDALAKQMNEPGAAEKLDAALFGDPAKMGEAYKPETTNSSPKQPSKKNP